MRSLAILAALAAALALSALPGSKPDRPPADAPSTESETVAPEEGRQLTGAGADRAGLLGESGTAVATACDIVPQPAVEREADAAARRDLGPLERTANDSLDLSFCEYRETTGEDLFVRVGLDTATRAVRRYYNRITEARQLPNIFDPSEDNRPKLVFGIGDDGTYGGAGAFWIPSTLDLTSIKDGRIVKVHFYIPGVPERRAKQAAAELARLAFAGYARAERTGG